MKRWESVIEQVNQRESMNIIEGDCRLGVGRCALKSTYVQRWYLLAGGGSLGKSTYLR